ncbi:hypothetical protein [Streptomyces sp.]|uniref:hypothetical protein n=1 Tax=Streptomyces sp. TaxID=1931 RepID=UPI002D3B7E5B|nr:hypothetical protein [Streptomyces sp.]HZF88080.1 hypothetical protein [Streptomyces sp.]
MTVLEPVAEATGPRRHEDRVLDVLALMARAVPDPRGRTGLDDAAQVPEREGSPTYPFAVVDISGTSPTADPSQHGP